MKYIGVMSQEHEVQWCYVTFMHFRAHYQSTLLKRVYREIVKIWNRTSKYATTTNVRCNENMIHYDVECES